MTRWRAVSKELREADPAVVNPEARERVWNVVSDALAEVPIESGAHSWRPSSRGRRGIAAAVFGTAAVVAVVIALLPGTSDHAVPGDPLAAAAIAAADQEPIELADDEFFYRRSETWRIAAPDLLPGLAFSRDVEGPQEPSVTEREIWLNYTGGGDTRSGLIAPEPGPARRCSSGDVLLGMIIDGFGICPLESGSLARGGLLLDESVELDGTRDLFSDNGGLAEIGDAVDELPTDPERLKRTLDQAAEQRLPSEGGYSPGKPSDSARKLELVTGILANPIGSPELRAAVFEYAATIDGVETSDSVTDPTGREGASVSLVEPAQTESISFGTSVDDGTGVVEDDVDLSGTRIMHELIFDPNTSDVLATRIAILESPAEPLREWLDSRGTPLTVEYTVFEPTEVVTRPDLVLERVQCADGSYVVRRAERDGPCAGQLHPSLRGEVERLFRELQAANDPAEEARIEAKLDELQERSDELNIANPKAPTPGDTDTVIEP